MAPKNILGKAIIKDRFRHHTRARDDDSFLHTTDLEKKHDAQWVKLQSITQENDLDAFLRKAELEETDFTAERLNVKIISSTSDQNPYLLSSEQEKNMRQMMEINQGDLKVPRRPSWNVEMTAEELQQKERTAFLEWRRNLAILEEQKNMVLTPFERNIEVWRQLWRVVERSDVILQIVDARNPLFFRCKDLEDYVKELNSTKRVVLLVNKADLLSERQRTLWLEYFKKNSVDVLFFSALLSSTDSAEDHQLGTSYSQPQILSPEQLYEKLLSMKDPAQDQVVVGLVGYPNVGKSSTINSLTGSKKVNVSATPGKTKHFQTIKLSEEMTLCDCPGLVFPNFAFTKAEMVINGVLPIDQLREYTGPCDLVAQRIPRYFLEYLYGIKLPSPSEGEDLSRPPRASELLSAYAIIRGFFKTGHGNPDESRAARIILKDFVNGKLLFCQPPPGMEPETFNSDHYSEGGMKFEEAKIAQEKVAQRRKAPSAFGSGSSIDNEFFKDNSNSGKIHMTGKFKAAEYGNRVQLFPHQSGYVINSTTPSYQGSVATSATTLNTEKKGHKNGKRRVKDRSWRA